MNAYLNISTTEVVVAKSLHNYRTQTQNLGCLNNENITHHTRTLTDCYNHSQCRLAVFSLLIKFLARMTSSIVHFVMPNISLSNTAHKSVKLVDFGFFLPHSILKICSVDVKVNSMALQISHLSAQRIDDFPQLLHHNIDTQYEQITKKQQFSKFKTADIHKFECR